MITPRRLALSARVLAELRLRGIPEPVPEYHFAREVVGDGPGVRSRLVDAELADWRFDYAWPKALVALEVEGGIWRGQSRHTTGSGYAEDVAKYNAAAELGWKVIRIVDHAAYDARAYRMLARLLA